MRLLYKKDFSEVKVLFCGIYDLICDIVKMVFMQLSVFRNNHFRLLL